MIPVLIAALLCVLFAVLCCAASGHPHQHPHRNGAEGANGLGVDQIHNRSNAA